MAEVFVLYAKIFKTYRRVRLSTYVWAENGKHMGRHGT